MNNFIIAGTIRQPSLTTGEKTTCRATLVFPGLRDEDPDTEISLMAWGETAAKAQADAPAIIIGNLNIGRHESGAPDVTLYANRLTLLSSLDEVTLNSITLVGRAGRDPEVRYFESGSCVADLSLAVNRRSRDSDPDWFNLKIWGKQAQVAADYVRKGSLLGIVGSFGFESWTDRSTGEMRCKPVVRVDRLDLLGGKRDAEAAAGWGDGSSEGEALF